jgi:hypothetical protein
VRFVADTGELCNPYDMTALPDFSVKCLKQNWQHCAAVSAVIEVDKTLWRVIIIAPQGKTCTVTYATHQHRYDYTSSTNPLVVEPYIAYSCASLDFTINTVIVRQCGTAGDVTFPVATETPTPSV